MFKSSVKNLKFRPTDGMALIIRGHISVYDQRGEYQLISEYLEPAGVGALQMAFMQLKEKLAGEGLFAENHKIAMPRYPGRIGVITSPTGAAIHDIINVLKRRFAALEVLICPVRVQGDGAAIEIASAIGDMNRLAEVDVLIVGRGGGSLEDLWPFNEEVVARAVYRSKIPVISAVGHETDWSICDFVADLRAPTPSAAAEMVIASADELRGQIEAFSQRLKLLMKSRMSALDARLCALKGALHDPGRTLGHLAQRVDDLTGRLDLALLNSVRGHREAYGRVFSALLHLSPAHRIETLRQQVRLFSTQSEHSLRQALDAFKHHFGDNAARLDVLSPLRTLARGYAIASRSDNGQVVSDAAALTSGDKLLVTLYRGKAFCRVETLERAGT